MVLPLLIGLGIVTTITALKIPPPGADDPNEAAGDDLARFAPPSTQSPGRAYDLAALASAAMIAAAVATWYARRK